MSSPYWHSEGTRCAALLFLVLVSAAGCDAAPKFSAAHNLQGSGDSSVSKVRKKDQTQATGTENVDISDQKGIREAGGTAETGGCAAVVVAKCDSNVINADHYSLLSILKEVLVDLDSCSDASRAGDRRECFTEIHAVLANKIGVLKSRSDYDDPMNAPGCEGMSYSDCANVLQELKVPSYDDPTKPYYGVHTLGEIDLTITACTDAGFENCGEKARYLTQERINYLSNANIDSADVSCGTANLGDKVAAGG